MSNFHTALVDRVELFDIEPTKWMACKAVLRAIANHANEQEADLAWPGVELLMLETGASESVIVRTTTLLAKKGWITKKRRMGTSNLYRLNVVKLQEHQAQRSAPQPVFMAKHLPGMEFPGEDLKAGKSGVTGRSTARERAAKRSDQGKRQSDVSDTANRRASHGKSTGARRQSGDQTVREESENSQANSDPSAGAQESARPSDQEAGPNTKANSKARPEGPAADLLRGLRLATPVTEQVVQQCHAWVSVLLDTWDPEVLSKHFETEATGGSVLRPMALLTSVVRRTLPRVARRDEPKPRPDWCGECDSPDSRMVEAPSGGFKPCKECNPQTQGRRQHASV